MFDVHTVIGAILFVAMLYASGKWDAHEEKRRVETEKKRIGALMSQKMQGHKSPPDWYERRKYVLDRDHHQCTRCGGTGSLHVHHVIPRKVSWDHSVENLVTLCNECHGKEHNTRFASNHERELKRYLRQLAHLGQRVKARKPHACGSCRSTIKNGEAYIRIEGKDFPYHVRHLFQQDYAKLCVACSVSMAAKKTTIPIRHSV